MFYQTEAKPQGWRAVAVFDDRTDRLLYLGRSSTQVRANFGIAFFEVLDDEAPRPAGDTPAPARPRRQPVA